MRDQAYDRQAIPSTRGWQRDSLLPFLEILQIGKLRQIKETSNQSLNTLGLQSRRSAQIRDIKGVAKWV